MNIVLFAPSGATASAIRQLAPDPERDRITVVSRAAPDADVHSIVLQPALMSLTRSAERALGGSAAGRNLLRLSPLDPGRRFSGAARHHRELRARVAAADLIVALERDGILAAWKSVRRWAGADAKAVYGIAPARTLLAAARD
ncbi:hypothetical protein [Agromyces sp. S2-1-8]|jgi:hypothetical protein|uniref:hypothetical protein n=1 Tax=Agromyces sp. S2-1-8 TaxID=2897180 RepID=UPI001E443A63|nr:hypothetical protein [Agromyces sp. S2-1-8]MCD5347772.1 hypothetical protein [Agromyces sp. S2-1-8]